MDNIQYKSIDSEREFAIKKGKVLEKFQESFFQRHKYDDLYRHVLELLIRDADPYQIIEKLIEINEEQFTKIKELIMMIPPQHKSK